MDTLFDYEPPRSPLPAERSNIVPRATVRDMVRRRQAALDRFSDAYAALQAAQGAQTDALIALQAITGKTGETSSYLHGTKEEDRHWVSQLQLPQRTDFLATARKIVDRRMWAHIIELTELERLMDKQAKDQLRQELMDTVPEATEENIFATVQQFAADAGTIFKRGIANCFSKLDRRFRSHDGWKIGGRVVLTYCFDEWGSFAYRSNHRDTLHDIDRTFHVLDGGATPHLYGGIVARIEESRRDGGFGRRQSECESEFFKIRCFKNGNAHVWFKRDDLLGKVNKLLGEYYGAPIPEEREAAADPLAERKTSLAKNYGFFPTPDKAADTLIERSLLRHRAEDQRLMVLEPSAGTGQLAQRIAKTGATVHCVEYQPQLAAALQARGFKVICTDFLSVAPLPLYDRVVMNPPFDRERDIDHVMHALQFLKPDGVLIAIISAGTEWRETKKATAFRALMEKMNASWQDLPEGSFASVGTNVNTVILRVHKNATAQR